MTYSPGVNATSRWPVTAGVLALLAFAPSGLRAEDTAASANPASGASLASGRLSEQFGPFKFSVGHDDAGGFGANLDGTGRWDAGSLNGPEPEGGKPRLWLFKFASLLYSATGSWGSEANATNNASLSLKPGIDGLLAHGIFQDHARTPAKGDPPIICDEKTGRCTQNGIELPLAVYPTNYVGFGFAGDVELRYGAFKQNSTVVTAREVLAGGQGYLTILLQQRAFGSMRVLADPRFSVTYYHPMTAKATTDVALPAGVKADYVDGQFETVLGFGGQHTSTVKFDFKLDASKATSGGPAGWQNLWTGKVWLPGLTFNGVNPTITYQSGKNGGFTYDRQVLIGVLCEFLNPGASGK